MISLFCRHDWRMLSEKITESKIEHAINTMEGFAAELNINFNYKNTERKYIQVFVCGKCGAFKRFVEAL